MDNPKKTLLDELLVKARSAQQHSYSPYSNFKVGAAIAADDGNHYAGCNVENASYPLGQCAEATAIGQMVSAGSKQIKDIVIVSPNDSFLSPCGGCRQKIIEFADENTQVHLVNQSGDRQTLSAEELLPHGFGKQDLK